MSMNFWICFVIFTYSQTPFIEITVYFVKRKKQRLWFVDGSVIIVSSDWSYINLYSQLNLTVSRCTKTTDFLNENTILFSIVPGMLISQNGKSGKRSFQEKCMWLSPLLWRLISSPIDKSNVCHKYHSNVIEEEFKCDRRRNESKL